VQQCSAAGRVANFARPVVYAAGNAGTPWLLRCSESNRARQRQVTDVVATLMVQFFPFFAYIYYCVVTWGRFPLVKEVRAAPVEALAPPVEGQAIINASIVEAVDCEGDGDAPSPVVVARAPSLRRIASDSLARVASFGSSSGELDASRTPPLYALCDLFKLQLGVDGPNLVQVVHAAARATGVQIDPHASVSLTARRVWEELGSPDLMRLASSEADIPVGVALPLSAVVVEPAATSQGV
jgi:hypothetical protein